MDNTDFRTAKKRTRAVSDLNEEQVQQKRRVDRKAQRAFRQRTRDRISDLEQQVIEIQESSRQKESLLHNELQKLREHNKTLVYRLEGIAHLATTTPSSHGDDASLHDHHGRESMAQPEQVYFPIDEEPGTASSPISVAPQEERYPLSSQVAIPNAPQSVPVPIDSSNPASQPESECNTPLPGAIEEPSSAYIASNVSLHAENGRKDPLESYSFQEATLNAARSSPLSSEIPLVAEAVSRPDPLPALLISKYAIASPSSEKRPVHTVLPAHMAPTCPLDQILIGFFNSRREMLSQGHPAESVIGPQKASVKALVYTEMSLSVHPLSRVMSEVMSTYPFVGKSEQLALFYCMHQTMRWQISTTKEDYLFMPPWLRPTVTQITVPHAAWIDNVPWPGVRDLLVEHPEDYPYSLWTENFTQNVSVNWKFDISDALSETDNGIFLHSIFEKHVRKLKNWTVSAEFARLVPNLMPAIYSSD